MGNILPFFSQLLWGGNFQQTEGKKGEETKASG